MADANLLYGAIEVGGIIRSRDGGEHWENLSHGQYLNDDPVDMHGVLASSWRPGRFSAWRGRACFAARTGGIIGCGCRLNRSMPKNRRIAAAFAKCRVIRKPFGSPQEQISKWPWARYSAAPMAVDTWKRVDMGAQPKTTIFGLAFDERNPRRMLLLFHRWRGVEAEDSGTTWSTYSLPEGATQVYALACC